MNDQPVPKTDPVSKDTPGLSYQPQVPVGAETEPVKTPETQPASTETASLNETLPNAETAPRPEVQTIAPTPVQEPFEQQPQEQTLPKEPPQNVVDFRTGQEELENVDPDADTTTKEADKEEKEFIEEVEKQHANS